MKHLAAILFFLCRICALCAQQIEFSPQIGLLTGVTQMAISPDDRFLVTGCMDGSILIWDTKYGFELYRMQVDNDSIRFVGFTQENTLFYSSKYEPIKAWKVGSSGSEKFHTPGRDARDLPRRSPHSKIITTESNVKKTDQAKYALSPGGEHLAVDDEYGFKIYPVEKSISANIKMKGGIFTKKSMAFSHDGRYFAAASVGSFHVKIWEVGLEEPIMVLKQSKRLVRQIALSRDGTCLASVSEEGVLQLWDARQGVLIPDFQEQAGVSYVAFSPTEDLLLYSSADKVTVLDLSSHQKLDSFSISTDRFLISNDGRYVFAYGWPGIEKWELSSGKKLKVFTGSCAYIGQALFHPKEPFLFLAVSNRIVQTDPRQLEMASNFMGHEQHVKDMAISKDGALLISGAVDGEIMVWDIDTKEIKYRFKGPEEGIKKVAVSPDGLYVAGGGKDSSIWIWSLADSALLVQYTYKKTLNDLTFSADGKDLFAGFEFGLAKLNPTQVGIEELRCSSSSDEKEIRRMELSPDGKQLVFVSGNFKVFVWDIDQHKVVSKVRDNKYDLFVPGRLLGFLMKLHPGGKLIYLLDEDDRIRCRDLQTEAVLRSVGVNSTIISNMTISSDGRYLALAMLGRLKLYALPELTELGTFILFDRTTHGTWVTPEGYYSGPSQTDAGFVFIVDQKAYPMEQFELRFNRPDIVVNSLGNTDWDHIDRYRGAYRKRLEKMGISEDQLSDDFHIPEVRIRNEADIPNSTYNNSLELQIEVMDSLYLPDRLMIWVNDNPIHGRAGYDLSETERTSGKCQLTIPVVLVPGENRIQVSARNNRGAESYRETLFVTYEGEEQADFYFLGIGIDTFLYPTLNLRFPVKDIQDMQGLFNLQENYYRRFISITLTNEEVTLENIRALKDSLLQSRPWDKIVLYFSTHGLIDSELNYFLATFDTDPENPAARGLSYEKLEDLFDGIPARNKLIILDACHAGEYDKEFVEAVKAKNTTQGKLTFFRSGETTIKPKMGLENSFAKMKEVFADLRRSTGAIVISSAAGEEVALEGQDWNNSVFAFCVQLGLLSTHFDIDFNHDGSIAVSELQLFLEKAVPVFSDNHQQPTYRIENRLSDFGLWIKQ